MFLAIDIGTSSAKVICFDPSTAIIQAVASREYKINRPTPGYAEQNPEDWWKAVVHAVGAVMQSVEPESIKAIGLTGQMHGVVLLDNEQHVCHPAIIWADQRGADILDDMLKQVSAEAFTSIAGTMPAAGFMGATLFWLRRHQPEWIDQTHNVILSKDYIRLRLTGEVGTDISDAAATALFNVRQGDWSDVIIDELDLPRSIFPKVSGSAEVVGQLTGQAANELGLPIGVPVVAGCADQPAQALANGLIKPGIASVTTGTGGQVFVPLTLDSEAALPIDKRLHVFNHAFPGRWYALGAILSAGAALRWLRQITGFAGQVDAYDKMSVEAATITPGSDGLIFLPYLDGERTPHMDPSARGAFIGLSAHHTRAHLIRAVMEGVAYALRQTLEISLALGEPVEKIIAAGGGAESDVWRQIQADVFGIPLQRTLQPEQTSLGAAILAGVGGGIYPTIEAGCVAVARYGEVTSPIPKNHDRYNTFYEQFVSLYPQLKDEFHTLVNLTK